MPDIASGAAGVSVGAEGSFSDDTCGPSGFVSLTHTVNHINNQLEHIAVLSNS